jgi:hypothetical protein
MNIQEIHQLYDGLGKILELAEKNQKNSLDATREMHNAIRNFEQTTQQLKGQIQKDFSLSINTITSQATSNLEKSAKKASEYYKNERRSFWVIMIISIPVLLFLYMHVVRLTTPSLSDIVRTQHDLNQIKSEIENKKKELIRRSLRIKSI